MSLRWCFHFELPGLTMGTDMLGLLPIIDATQLPRGRAYGGIRQDPLIGQIAQGHHQRRLPGRLQSVRIGELIEPDDVEDEVGCQQVEWQVQQGSYEVRLLKFENQYHPSQVAEARKSLPCREPP